MKTANVSSLRQTYVEEKVRSGMSRLWRRCTDSNAARFLWYWLGVRRAATGVSPAEHDVLRSLATGKTCVVEVGVFEGRTSRVFADAISPDGRVYLVDPYFRETVFERILRISFTEWIARREVRAVSSRVEFCKRTSEEAARRLNLDGTIDLVFVDARHDYDSARTDFLVWSRKLRSGGVIAMHDARTCIVRPDLTPETGSVRFATEVLAGAQGAWSIVGEVDSVLAFQRADGGTPV